MMNTDIMTYKSSIVIFSIYIVNVIIALYISILFTAFSYVC